MKPSSNLPCLPVGLIVLGLSSFALASPAEDPVLDLKVLKENGLNVTMRTGKRLPIYVDRKAGRMLDIIAPQTITILAIDRYGLQIRGKGKNGALTGWIGQKQLFGSGTDNFKQLQAFYRRQLEIEKLVAEKRPAIGMSLFELKRILGKPTSHRAGEGEEEEDQAELLTWVAHEKVNLNEAIGLGTDADVLKMRVEVGRVEVTLVEELAKRITMNADAGAPDIPKVVPPIATPFGPAPKRAVAEK